MCFITWVLTQLKNFITELLKNEGGGVFFLDVLPVIL